MQFNYWFLALLQLIGVYSTVGHLFSHNVSIHVLDSRLGKPGVGARVTLFKLDEHYQEKFVYSEHTNNDGKVTEFTSPLVKFTKGVYKFRVDSKEYFASKNRSTYYPFVDIAFEVNDASIHHHVPLLLSANSYTTYRGSTQRNFKGNTKPNN